MSKSKKILFVIISILLYLVVYFQIINFNDYLKSILGFHFINYDENYNVNVITLFIVKSAFIISLLFLLITIVYNWYKKIQIIKSLSIFYTITLVYLLIIKGLNPELYFNIHPSVLQYASFSLSLSISLQEIANIIIFIPLPIIVYIFTNKYKVLTPLLLISVTIEITQLIFNIGQFDIMDIIYNTLGLLIGNYILKSSLSKRGFELIKHY